MSSPHLTITAFHSSMLGGQAHHGYAATAPVRVPANVEWVSTGIFVEESQTIYLVTQGKAITAPLATYMKCCLNFLTPDGRMIPFCTYNSVGYRERVMHELVQVKNAKI